MRDLQREHGCRIRRGRTSALVRCSGTRQNCVDCCLCKSHIRSLNSIISQRRTFVAAINHTLTILSESYPQLSESAQCSVFLTIGRLACISEANATDKLTGLGEESESSRSNVRCSICDGWRASAALNTTSECVVAAQLLSIYNSLLQLPQMQKRKRPTVLAMIALKRLLTHTKDPKSLDLTNSIHGQWCMKALQNPARDIRIAAGSVNLQRIRKVF